ncbi:sensor histidine kinase [Micromonospora pisi]|uniref:sensor histidine kinase n=1 Tax=Micromonospora pisi TaxID=589240 RepID=UPI001FE9710B|nr:histidine kinase [Micromonospora pisi]
MEQVRTAHGAAGVGVRLLGRAVRLVVGVLLGTVTAVVDLTYLLWSGLILVPVWPHPGARRSAIREIQAGARHLAEVERWRLAAFLNSVNSADYTGRRAVEYLCLRWAVGLLGGAVLLIFAYGAVAGLVWLAEWVAGQSGPLLFAGQLVLGLIGLFLVAQGLLGMAALDRRLGRLFFGPSDRELLERRISELAVSRAGIVEAVDAERRRIERDLHDGLQQRLVALGMLLGRARRSADPERAGELLRQAHEESRSALDDLREVAWRVYPTALDNLGLDEALARVADRAGMPVTVHYRLVEQPPARVRTAAYFVVSEAVTNAAKHARAGRVVVDVAPGQNAVVVAIDDDGIGGADPAGSGLAGLARRVAALDGTFRVDSPVGGPTTIVAEFPCG